MSGSAVADKITANDIVDMLRERHGGRDWAFFPQVPDGTGMNQRRTADAVAMSLWPSRGLEIHGFEIKVSRTDWQKELKDPSKADSICQYCDRWWIVAPKGIVKKDELPKTWGLMEANGDGLRIAVQSPVKDAVPVDRAFVAGLFRAAEKFYKSPEFLGRELWKKHEEGIEQGRRDSRYDVERWKGQYERLNKSVQEFTTASGIDIEHEWNLGEIGNAAKVIADGGLKEMGRNASWVLGHARRITQACEEIVALTGFKKDEDGS